jgi:hypothetical protein
MTKKPPAKPDDPEQSKRFVDAAHEAQADETEQGADKAFKKVVTKAGSFGHPKVLRNARNSKPS